MSINAQEANRLRVITPFQAGKKLIEIFNELSISYYTVQKIVSRYKKTELLKELNDLKDSKSFLMSVKI